MGLEEMNQLEPDSQEILEQARKKALDDAARQWFIYQALLFAGRSLAVEALESYRRKVSAYAALFSQASREGVEKRVKEEVKELLEGEFIPLILNG